jgi:hypothetical protein
MFSGKYSIKNKNKIFRLMGKKRTKIKSNSPPPEHISARRVFQSEQDFGSAVNVGDFSFIFSVL